MTTLIEISNTSKAFSGKNAVCDISFSVNKGEIVGLLGTNGAGKTTTMRMIAGYLPQDSGTILIDGKDTLENPVICKAKIGYLPEGAPLYPELTPKILLNFIAKAHNLDENFISQRMKYVIENLHLEPVLDNTIDTLSKGYKRRVAFACAIFHDPKILILDEPTDGLDPIQKQEVRYLIRNLATNKAIIISTHILDEVTSLCDRIVIINQGKIVINTLVKDLLLKHPKQDFEQIFRNYVGNNNNYY